MNVVILCGGLGTRLREETEFRPKPMVEVGGRPILWHIMKIFAHYQLHDFILCLGYRGNMIKEYFLNYESMNSDFTLQLGTPSSIRHHGAHAEHDFNVTLADTGLNTNTGGRVKRVAHYLDDDTFMVTYGDGVIDVNIEKVLAYHRSHGKLATVTSVRPVSRYGILELQPDGRVRRFSEKPQAEGWINAGFFVLNRKILDLLTDDACIMEHEPLERLAADGQLMAYRHEGFFHPMDTYRDYEALNKLWSTGQAPWKVWKD